MLGLEEYAEAFKRGLNYVLYGSNQNREIPTVDNGNLESLGYHDGYVYGEYCEMTGQAMSISQEQLIAVIDKSHSRALNIYNTYMQENINQKGQIK